MTPDEILLVAIPIFWLFTLIMAYKVGHVEGGFEEFERLTRLSASVDEYGGVE